MAQDRHISREYLEALIIAAIFLQFANTFVVQTYYIPSGSMEDTLLVGDHLFVNRFIYGPAPTELERKLLPLRPVRRGDIIVFRSKENARIDVVKRAIGVPGDTIRIVDKKVFVNGKAAADSRYAIHRPPPGAPEHVPPDYLGQLASRDYFGPFTVPPASYFCMGDNRDNSWDSRFWGELPATYVLGRAFAIYWSKGGQSSETSPPDWGSRLADLGQTVVGFFGVGPYKTRWTRTFKLVR